MASFQLIENAFKEDLPDGDITTDSLGVGRHLGFAQLMAKENLVLSGTTLFCEAIHYLNPECQINWLFKNGEWVLKGQTIASLEGDLIQILKAERVGLNFLGKLCGIATLTRCFVKEV
ncbi:nicotinate-nucleotide diphosphorylase (carboxylating), partial [Bdellovibrionales bacterium]|nr:nicotinate-nucleotide diphosphorylase (carboxylating) [Bdellovibrionales bacterium]